jgi:MFS family permease
LLKNRQMTVSVITMALFAIAFFGAMLLFPSYFLQVRGEKTLSTGLLLIPQGLGAMITMPLAGRLTDTIGPGKIVLTGIALIIPGMAVFTQVTATTPYPLLLGALFVMGLGMGAAMMPIFTAALQTLTHASVARGSTLMNIVQQIASSIGTATMSVVLTNQIQSHALAGPAIASWASPAIEAKLGTAAISRGLEQAADSFGFTFTVALALIILCFIPASLLPRRKASAATSTAGTEAALAH